MASLLAQLKDKRDQLQAERDELFVKAEAASSFDDVRERIEEIDAELPTLDGDLAREQAHRAHQRIAPAVSADQEGAITQAGAFKPLAGSPAQQFLGAADWQDYVKRIAPTGQISQGMRIESPKVPIEGSMVPWLRRHGAEVVTGLSSTSGGALVISDQTGIIDDLTQRPVTILDLLTRGTTDSDVLEYVRVTGYTKAAVSVPEATHIVLDDEAGTGISHKPWSQLALARVSDTVKTIAVGTPATNRALSDAGQLRTLIDGELRYDLEYEVERQVVAGDGADEDFEGILEVANTQSQAFETSIVYTLRRALTKVRIGGRARPNGIAMNPEDIDALYFEALTSTAPGMAAILTELAAGRIHGVRLVEAEAVTAGTAIAADFRRAFLWDRQQSSIQATSGYMDFFMRNMVAILAELRAGFGVIRPQAFVIVDLGS